MQPPAIANNFYITPIFELRGRNVIVDRDVAGIYGVQTRDVNRAVKNNPGKFPPGYIFNMNASEIDEVVQILHHLEQSSLRWKISTAKFTKTRVLPNAFTEKGLYMLATILKSARATSATLKIIETFAKLREFGRVAKSLADENLSKTKQQQLVKKSGQLIGDILNNEFADDVGSETTIELNLAMIKVKHTIKKRRK